MQDYLSAIMPAFRAPTRPAPTRPAPARRAQARPSNLFLDPPTPELVIGMISSLGKVEQRLRVRKTVFDSPAASQVAWRFLVGNNTHRGLVFKRWTPEADGSTFGDVLYFGTDGGSWHSKHCSCSEKTRFWFQYALRRWPLATWIGKTEDDTFVSLHLLLFDLSRRQMHAHPLSMYGLMNLCTATHYASSAKGCFLGDFEHQSLLTMALTQHAHGACQKQPPVPFPTGPLAVMSAGLARAIFEECAYMREYEAAAARLAARNGHAGCASSNVRGTFLDNNACDCAVGGWVQRCVRNATLASMTWSKGHHNAQTGGGMGWVRPDNHSVAVHYLKSPAEGPWETARNATADVAATPFPPLLWAYSNDPVTTPTTPRFRPLRQEQHSWYTRTCQRPPMVFAARYRASGGGGNPSTWSNFGCHESRGFPSPQLADKVVVG